LSYIITIKHNNTQQKYLLLLNGRMDIKRQPCNLKHNIIYKILKKEGLLEKVANINIKRTQKNTKKHNADM
jgi:hypothetical protein